MYMPLRKDILTNKKKQFGAWYQYSDLQKPQRNDIKLMGKVLTSNIFNSTVIYLLCLFLMEN